ncbi:MAG: hypothetical protein JWO63_553, partial [Frankiales bacterium]|nr:hypothetical protein [Frankiales bacterium]
MADSAASPASDDWRDERALARFELFLFTAVATVLVVRTALAVTGYPQVGGGGLHVAHVLWGGLLMGVAIVLVEILPGTRIRIRAAFIGGIGFGLFIDEIGKFLTKDVNYFFKPAIAIMYGVFVVAYLVVRTLLAHRRLDDRRRLALAAAAVTDLSLGQLDTHARNYALTLLEGVDANSGLRKSAEAIREALTAQQPASRSLESSLSQLRDRVAAIADRALGSRLAERLVIAVICVAVADVVINAVVSMTNPGRASLLRTALDTGLPSLISAGLVIAGGIRIWRGHQQGGLRLIQSAVLLKLLFTQVVVFNREQLFGLVGFAFDLAVLAVLRLMLDPQTPTPGLSPTPDRTYARPT